MDAFFRNAHVEATLNHPVPAQVEPDGFAALAAAQHLDRVYEGAAPRGGAFPPAARARDRPRPGTAEAVAHDLDDGAYDAIVLSDVLEHAVAPDRLLRLLAPKLADGGRVCVSVPNARFWSEFARPRAKERFNVAST